MVLVKVRIRLYKDTLPPAEFSMVRGLRGEPIYEALVDDDIIDNILEHFKQYGTVTMHDVDDPVMSRLGLSLGKSHMNNNTNASMYFTKSGKPKSIKLPRRNSTRRSVKSFEKSSNKSKTSKSIIKPMSTIYEKKFHTKKKGIRTPRNLARETRSRKLYERWRRLHNRK
jgi:hypothetical protein